ncbi:MAG: DUF3231 family protein [Firmicutes bacterium]|nr:DUF3231 family protein [Bacillota bacterium]
MPSIFKKVGAKKTAIDIEEAWNIWELLSSGYESMTDIKLMKNFVHDQDLTVMITRHLASLDDEIKMLEAEAIKYNLKTPHQPPADFKTSAIIEEYSDRYIYRTVFRRLGDDLFKINRSIRTSSTNDKLRQGFQQRLRGQLKNFEEFIKYGKLKGWQDPPPTYKIHKPQKREQLLISEAFHLWDHLNQRYDQLHLTSTFKSMTHDIDLQAILTLGAGSLSEEITMLEGLMTKFEIPMPERPPVSTKVPIDPEVMEDVFMFRTILTGLQEAQDLHLRAIVQTELNDNLRKIFTTMLFNEMSLYDKLLKYGKAKGWTHPAPIYTEPT